MMDDNSMISFINIVCVCACVRLLLILAYLTSEGVLSGYITLSLSTDDIFDIMEGIDWREKEGEREREKEEEREGRREGGREGDREKETGRQRERSGFLISLQIPYLPSGSSSCQDGRS